MRDTKKHKIGLVARREWGAPAYSEDDRERLDLIARAFHWLFHNLETDGYFSLALEVPTRQEQVEVTLIDVNGDSILDLVSTHVEVELDHGSCSLATACVNLKPGRQQTEITSR